MLTLPAAEPAYHALTTMRRLRSQFALVEDRGELLGLVTMQDLLDQRLPAPHTRRTGVGAHVIRSVGGTQKEHPGRHPPRAGQRQ